MMGDVRVYGGEDPSSAVQVRLARCRPWAAAPSVLRRALPRVAHTPTTSRRRGQYFCDSKNLTFKLCGMIIDALCDKLPGRCQLHLSLPVQDQTKGGNLGTLKIYSGHVASSVPWQPAPAHRLDRRRGGPPTLQRGRRGPAHRL